MWAQMNFSMALPWADWGAMRIRLGTSDNIALFGETYKSAREQQRAARKAHGYTGRDMYTGIPAEAGITVRHYMASKDCTIRQWNT